MWEKIVLNLLSNAFKFTFAGEIAVSLDWCGDHIEFKIRDTGTSIPEHELPQIFERFHRIRDAPARTHEGTGIGLALVQELVHLHGGRIAVASEVGMGTTFTVTVPTGIAHLPADRVGATRRLASTAVQAEAFVEEALRWLPTETETCGDIVTLAPSAAQLPPLLEPTNSRLLVADDNADMCAYLRRLLSPHWQVVTVADGEQALTAIHTRRPDLVLADIMMPRMDGLALLRALRADPRTATIPVVLLSARAGEEARVEGLEAGADDYLVKPFVARELLARVEAHLNLARLRGEMEATLRESESRFRHMADNAPVMIWVTEPDATCTYLNTAWYSFTGQTPATGLGFGWLEAVHPDDREEAHRTFFAANAQYATFRLEYRLRRHDGAYHWAIDAAAPRFGPQGEFLGYIGSVIDIMERKQAEEALQDMNADLEQRVAARTADLKRAHDDLRREMGERQRVQEALFQQEKLTALGTLLASVAHELNNPLSVAAMQLDNLQDEAGAGSRCWC
jgi:PAS domain S-box-containing protein